MDKKEEKLVEAIAKLHINHINQMELILTCNCNSINFWQMELKSLLENEPFYMFKKKHQEWEEKVKETKEHLNHLCNSFDNTLEELHKFKKSIKEI